MMRNDLTQKILFDPLQDEADELYILAAYATPNMLSWYIKNIYHKATVPIRINLIVRMVPFDNLSVSIHVGFSNPHLNRKSKIYERYCDENRD